MAEQALEEPAGSSLTRFGADRSVGRTLPKREREAVLPRFTVRDVPAPDGTAGGASV
jgi:hypothetical protein